MGAAVRLPSKNVPTTLLKLWSIVSGSWIVISWALLFVNLLKDVPITFKAALDRFWLLDRDSVGAAVRLPIKDVSTTLEKLPSIVSGSWIEIFVYS